MPALMDTPQSALLHADDGIPCLMDTPQSMACYRTIRHPTFGTAAYGWNCSFQWNCWCWWK